MARPRKRAYTQAQMQRETLRLWLDKLPPDVAAAAVLAGTAALAGFTPPFTRLLSMTSGLSGGEKDPMKDISDFWKVLSPGYAIIDWLVGPEGSEYKPPDEPGAMDKTLRTVGLFCMAALEGAMMYNAMKNPDVLTTMIKAPAEILKGIGSIVPG